VDCHNMRQYLAGMEFLAHRADPSGIARLVTVAFRC